MPTKSPLPIETDPPLKAPRRVGRPKGDTRERILDTALDLFVEQGYDKTSLREIAEQLGVSKAALYYHFERKEDILLALHLRLHNMGHDLLGQLGDVDTTATLDQWAKMLDGFIDGLLAHRDLFILHARNQNALETIHESEHNISDHTDLEASVRGFLSTPSIPLEVRVRLACGAGAIMIPLIAAGNMFGPADIDEVTSIVRDVAADLLRMPAQGSSNPR